MSNQTEMREKIAHLVLKYPGLHLREVARHLGTSVALVEYHVPHLMADGMIELEKDGRSHRLYPTGDDGMKAREKLVLGELRDPRRAAVLLHIMKHGPSKHGAMAQALGIGKSTLTFHLQHLSKRRVVTQDEGGFWHPHDRNHLLRVLKSYKPHTASKDKMAQIWNEFYLN